MASSERRDLAKAVQSGEVGPKGQATYGPKAAPSALTRWLAPLAGCLKFLGIRALQAGASDTFRRPHRGPGPVLMPPGQAGWMARRPRPSPPPEKTEPKHVLPVRPELVRREEAAVVVAAEDAAVGAAAVKDAGTCRSITRSSSKIRR